MISIQLTDKQKTAIKSYIPSFRKYKEGEQGIQDEEMRQRHVHYFQEELPEKIRDLSEVDIQLLVSNLWTMAVWGNTQWIAQQIVTKNGIDRLRSELESLLQTSESPGRRYERFIERIKHLGPASVTEMLHYIQPKDCGIWNQRDRQGLSSLGLTGYVDLEKYRISAEEYQRYNYLLLAIQSELEGRGISSNNLIAVDAFLYSISREVRPLIEPLVKGFDHDEVRDLIQNIGINLGFEAEIEVLVAHGAKVDSVWRARIGNLGLVTYVFEVHRSGSIDSLLLNLQKAKSNPTVQKVIAVSDSDQIAKIKNESEGLPEEFRRVLGFWEVDQVKRTAQNLEDAINVIQGLGLVSSRFP